MFAGKGFRVCSSTACNNIGYKLSFLIVEIQRLKIFEVIRSLSKQEKIVSYWGG